MFGNNKGSKIILTTLLVTVSLLLFVPSLATAEEPDFVYYRVEPGDFLWLIGWKFETTPGDIIELNNLRTTSIYPGQVLKIPKANTPWRELPNSFDYAVQPGDTLYKIAQKFDVNLKHLIEGNGLNNTMIYPSQVLKVFLSPQQRYDVQGGDTLYKVAMKFDTTIDTIVYVNRMKSNSLWVGQVLFVPVLPTEDDISVTPPAEEEPIITIPYGGQWGDIPPGVTLYRTKLGDNLWTIANQYNTSIAVIKATNHLHSDLIMLDQALFIPQGSTQPVVIPYPYAEKKEGFGELLDWKYTSWVLDSGNTAVIKDLVTGKSFKVLRLGGSNHADMEPLTVADTQIMKEIYGGQWSWNRRAVLVYVDGKVIAGSMAGMPHDIQTITNNNFNGHFDLHFLNSRTHNTNSIDAKHQQMVQKAAGN